MIQKKLIDSKKFLMIIERLCSEILERHPEGDVKLIGIHTRGVYLAGRLKENLELRTKKVIEMGTVDITFYRDDLMKLYEQPEVKETNIPFSVDDEKIILVDDVIYTGRTIRCAIDVLLDYGRPKKVELLVMVDRGHRELPIHPDYVGRRIPTSRDEIIDVRLKEIDGEDAVVLVKGF
ncbi:MAG: bifunctional pyr operon transcriptional regulator/uracil phosphoribosyltransferase PyrR [Candidatus Hydrothermales bacterium]